MVFLSGRLLPITIRSLIFIVIAIIIFNGFTHPIVEHDSLSHFYSTCATCRGTNHTQLTLSNPETGDEKLAFTMFLSGTLNQSEDLHADNYFICTRMLVWQLLHSPQTKSRRAIDVVVMVTPSVSQSRIEILKSDGAIIRPIEFIRREWGEFREPRWEDLLGKLRAWEMTEYSRIMFLDTDIILREPIDNIFDEEAAQFQKTLSYADLDPPSGAPPLPNEYVLASLGETYGPEHPFPPWWEGDSKKGGLHMYGYFNAGFMLLAPNRLLFDYFLFLVRTPYSFDPDMAEQNLLNSVHDWHGRVPWKELSTKWNVMYPNDDDLKGGLKSMHQKWFKKPAVYEHGNGEQVMKEIMSVRWKMEGWYEARQVKECK